MANRALILAFVRRFMILLVISILTVLVVSELAYRLTKDPASRQPATITLVIPAGTAQKVAAGQSVASLPSDMVFVVGDTLLVKNEDDVSHQLDILYIPAGASASLKLDQANDFAFACSFQPTRYLNLTVRQATTWETRLAALWYGVPTTLMFLLAYSFIFYPLRSGRKPDQDNPTVAP